MLSMYKAAQAACGCLEERDEGEALCFVFWRKGEGEEQDLEELGPGTASFSSSLSCFSVVLSWAGVLEKALVENDWWRAEA